MRIKFLGAINGEVTGSCIHFFYDRTQTQFLVDCGLFQGEYDSDDKNKSKFSFNPKDIKFVFLTHAHLDHCGLIPKLYRQGFSGEVICTTATAELAYLQLIDSCKYVRNIYDEKDVKEIRFKCIDQQTNFGLSRLISIDKDLKASFLRSSHILGATSINLSWRNQSGEWENIVLSGDIGGSTKNNPYNPLLASGQTPYGTPKYVVLESTYGNKIREPEFSCFGSRISKLKTLINENLIQDDKILIIPAFSLQRTQEIIFDFLYILGKNNNCNLTDEPLNFKINRLIKCCDEKGLPSFAYEMFQSLLSYVPDNIRNDWSNAFEAHDIEGKTTWKLKSDSKISLSDIIKFARSLKPIEIIIDSPLAQKMSTVFGKELCRPQIANPEQTIYRNKMISSRFNMEESKIDDLIQKIFPDVSNEEHVVYLGRHKIRYCKKFTLPDTTELKNKGIILITGAGMCEGGPVISHLLDGLERKDVTIFTTGYMARESVGNKLISLSNCQQEGKSYTFSSLPIGKKTIKTSNIQAQILQLGSYYSGHADLNTLLSYIKSRINGNYEQKCVKQNIFLTHGDDSSRSKLKEHIEKINNESEYNFDVFLPSNNDTWFNLDTCEWTENSDFFDETSLSLESLIKEQKQTNRLLEKLILLIEKQQPSTN